MADVRRITERNVSGVKKTRSGTDELLRQAEALSGAVGHLAKKPH
jgi:hypothetical protein